MRQTSRARRPLKSRTRGVAVRLARAIAGKGVSPNAISLASIACAVLAAACLALVPRLEGGAAQAALLVGAATFIQLRLAANLLDGMVAVEFRRRTATGDLFNELPDRLADVLILVGAGYAIEWVGWGEQLGWAVATLAVLTAYIRVLGGSLGLTQHFCGPMAKPHRMAALTAACLISLVELAAVGYQGIVMTVALVLIGLGTAATCVRRTRLLSTELRQR